MKDFQVEVKLQKQSKITQWNIFFFSFILIFLLTLAQHFVPRINLFASSPKTSTIEKITPKLEQKTNGYILKKPTSFIQPSFASGEDYNNASSYAAVDFDSGEVLAEKNLSKSFPIASLTKVMTAVVSLDLAKPEDLISISQKASLEEPTTIGVVEGQKMSVEELLDAALLTSANDAAQALRDGINSKYGSNIFVEAMNEKAKFLGLKNTSFANPQGFDSDKNYSTAEDLAILTNYALKNYPTIAKIVNNDYKFLPASKNHKQFDLYNWNGLLGVYPGVEGFKIGNTGDAGYTTIVVSKRGNKKITAVVLGAPGVLERDMWASQILDNAFKKLSNLDPVGLTALDLRAKYSTWKYWN